MDNRVYDELLVMNQPTVNRVGKTLLVKLSTENRKMLDTAAARNVMTFNDYKRLGSTELNQARSY